MLYADRLPYYSDEWAEICLEIYKKSVFRNTYGYYPNCLRIYFFRHPERIKREYRVDFPSFYGHFHYDYLLPNEAYEKQNEFETWCDYLYEFAKEDSYILSTFGSILGRSIPGKDGVYPHEFVRVILEKYSNDQLTRDMVVGWQNHRGAHVVQDGLYERKIEQQYRDNAHSMAIEYPQTAKLLSMIADNYRWESKFDQIYAELYPI